VPWLGIAQALEVPIEAFVLETPAEVCHERNRASDDPVPPEVVDRMAKAWGPVAEEGITARAVDGEGR
jgi:predicted kinase